MKASDAICIFSDTCITAAHGDIKKIREGIEELEFKP
jgi:hypothetical protein